MLRKIFRILLIVNFYISALLLIIAGLLKLSSDEVNPILALFFENNVITLSQFQFISRYLPLFEIVLGLIMITGFLFRFSSVISAFVYIIFTGGIIYASEGYLFLPIDCGCFGTGATTPAILLLLRNLIIFILLLYLGVKKTENQPYNIFKKK